VNDTISRKQAIETLIAEANAEGAYGYLDAKSIEDCLANMPPAEPERKMGEWIVISEFEDCRYVKCNQCKVTQVFYYNKPLTNFCPNCGAYMRSEQDGD